MGTYFSTMYKYAVRTLQRASPLSAVTIRFSVQCLLLGVGTNKPPHCATAQTQKHRRVTSDESQARHFGFLYSLCALFNCGPPRDDAKQMDRARPSEDDIERMKGREKGLANLLCDGRPAYMQTCRQASIVCVCVMHDRCVHL